MYRRAAPRIDPALPRRTARGGAGPGRGRLPVVCAGTGRNPAPSNWPRGGSWPPLSTCRRRAPTCRQGGYDDSGLASGPADALDRPRDPAATTGSIPIWTSAPICATTVPQDLYRQDWWYRTTFTAPAGHSNYTLQFPGINYRAEIWLNGQLLADSNRIVGMYSRPRPRRHPVDPGRASRTRWRSG